MNPSPASSCVPILEVNPDNPGDVELSFCPLDDLDDFLEDLADDYELGFGELGAFKPLKVLKKVGKVAIAPHKAAVKAAGAAFGIGGKAKGGGGGAVTTSNVNNACGALEIRWIPTCGGGGGGGGTSRGVSVSGQLIPQVQAALKTKFAPQVKAALNIQGPKIKLPKIKLPKVKAPKVKLSLAKQAKLAKLSLKAKAAGLKVPKIKLPKVKAPKVKIPKLTLKGPKLSIKGPKLSLKGPKLSLKAPSVKFAPKLSLSAKGTLGGKFSPIPLDLRAVMSKCDAIKAAAKIISLAPDVSKFSVSTKIKLGAALKGTPIRGKGHSKPARAAVNALRGSNVQCCVVAKSKAKGGGKTNQLAAKLKAKKRLKRGGPMAPLAFQSAVGTLLDKIEAKSPTSAVMSKAEKIRRLTGVQVRFV